MDPLWTPLWTPFYAYSNFCGPRVDPLFTLISDRLRLFQILWTPTVCILKNLPPTFCLSLPAASYWFILFHIVSYYFIQDKLGPEHTKTDRKVSYPLVGLEVFSVFILLGSHEWGLEVKSFRMELDPPPETTATQFVVTPKSLFSRRA